jgi:AraC-like DNA-binding protein
MLVIPPITAHHPFSDNKIATDIVLVLKLENICGERGFYNYFSSALASVSKKPIALDSELIEKIIQFNSLSLNNSLRDICYRKAVAYEIICLLFDTINGFCDTKIHEKLNTDNKLFTLENLVNDSKYSIAYISETLGYSPRHTSRVIKQIYGQSLKDVRFSNMTATAKRLMLSETDTPLTNIAQRTGFASLSAMNREFLKREGILPSEYRKMLLNKDEFGEDLIFVCVFLAELQR